MVGDVTADLLVTSAMVYHVNISHSNCDEFLRLTFDMISTDKKNTQRIVLFKFSQRPCPGKNCEIDYRDQPIDEQVYLGWLRGDGSDTHFSYHGIALTPVGFNISRE